MKILVIIFDYAGYYTEGIAIFQLTRAKIYMLEIFFFF